MTKLTKEVKAAATMIDVITIAYKNGDLEDYIDDEEVRAHIEANKDEIEFTDKWTYENRYA